MERFAALLFPVLAVSAFLRGFILPLRVLLRFGTAVVSGLLCLWILNSVSQFTGILFPINAVTVLAAGFLGLPGIGIMAILAVM